jgi:hypothetical protein
MLTTDVMVQRQRHGCKRLLPVMSRFWLVMTTQLRTRKQRTSQKIITNAQSDWQASDAPANPLSNFGLHHNDSFDRN